MTPAQFDLSIVIPAYMEAALITASLTQLADWLRTHDYGQVEVIVVVADSDDGTAKLAEAMAPQFTSLRVVKPGPRVGKGRDVRFGMLAATGRYRLYMDADLATPLRHLDDVAAGAAAGDDIIIAVRDLWSIHKGLLRKLISKLGNVVAQIVVVPGIPDTQCGFKAFRGDVATDVFRRQTMMGWSFDAELLAIARRHRYNITTFKAPNWTDPKDGNMGLVGDSPLHAAVSTFWDLLVIRAGLWTGSYR
ncbi:glycosyltransferase [Candidatus Saccharibacteria bacterium]|nr:glycosyltransferase [Candidatus Saccharibacteria bacterium]